MAFLLAVLRSALTRPERLSYGPSRSQVADLHVPDGPGPHPVVVLLHGGSWRARYGRLTTRPLALELVRRGWAVANLEYRRLGRGQGGGWPQTFDDVAAGIDALAAFADPRLDLGRVVAVGHSAGGQLALWAGARPGLPAGAPGAGPRVALRAVVGLASVCNLESAGETARAFLGGDPATVPERYAQADPMRRVPLAVPVVLVHSRGDETVPARRSREYAAAARSAGGDVELVEPEVGGHSDVIDPAHPACHAALEQLERLRRDLG